ncbi:hypothetical protein FRX31_012357 [Thalictrum thalictroides]|uniref:Uncharacterized protein n=1 Tax=Thalictrum thalictroides TaxID=46969 RepID=A0A7J6WM84_THATH|nr:hypothetical protein FRX31_012357 [Thalictrum thalictroides]
MRDAEGAAAFDSTASGSATTNAVTAEPRTEAHPNIRFYQTPKSPINPKKTQENKKNNGPVGNRFTGLESEEMEDLTFAAAASSRWNAAHSDPFPVVKPSPVEVEEMEVEYVSRQERQDEEDELAMADQYHRNAMAAGVDDAAALINNSSDTNNVSNINFNNNTIADIITGSVTGSQRIVIDNNSNHVDHGPNSAPHVADPSNLRSPNCQISSKPTPSTNIKSQFKTILTPTVKRATKVPNRPETPYGKVFSKEDKPPSSSGGGAGVQFPALTSNPVPTPTPNYMANTYASKAQVESYEGPITRSRSRTNTNSNPPRSKEGQQL